MAIPEKWLEKLANLKVYRAKGGACPTNLFCFL